ncbi:MAG: hypothetical protein V4683_03320 [Bacteroidota bacterium]
MKKAIAISLLSIYLVSSTELYQLLKLPILIEHYSEHKTQNNEMSFWDFLSLHYNQEFNHDNTDNKLPFKSHNICSGISLVAFIPNPFGLTFLKSPEYQPKKHTFYHKVFFISSVISSIWQPPRA